MKPARLRVTVTDAAGRRLARGPAAGLAAWLARHAPAAARGDVAIAIIPDRQMRQLNRQYRRKDYATDVLSFANRRFANDRGRASTVENSGDMWAAKSREFSTVEARPLRNLGDIAIARGVAGRQARDAGHDVRTELRILALHGLLHLMGYDHDEDQGEMARVEERLRRRAGLPAGLIARATGRRRSRRA